MFDKIRRHRGEPMGAEPGEHSEVLVLLNRIEAALVVRDPGNARSVEAYEGLRKQVIAAANERRRMLVMLVQLNTAIAAGASTNAVHARVDEWSDQAGLEAVYGPVTPELFEVTGPGEHLRVHRPAWVDRNSGMVVSRGIAEAVVVEASQDLNAAREEKTGAPGGDDVSAQLQDAGTDQGDKQ